ncbi:unnamed protein product [Ceratitis capitata]|uniref:(Mediterranean fruit fly) hypothetical protein n=1 Tax=Ceratitis capitata TaxID=7213 RepID=A0A811VCY6_CERCA|nr:unnamed protein product [Ceratitis capitata]
MRRTGHATLLHFRSFGRMLHIANASRVLVIDWRNYGALTLLLDPLTKIDPAAYRSSNYPRTYQGAKSTLKAFNLFESSQQSWQL